MTHSATTRSIHAGRLSDPASGALGAPIVQATAYAHDGVGRNRGHAYSRVSNPTVDALERALGAMEDAPPAVAFRSGCAALAAVFFTLLRPGDEIVVSDVVYGGTVRLLRELLAELGIRARFVDTSEALGLRAALTASTRLVLIETPGNPTLKLSDVEGAAAVCREAGVLLAVDNTFLTPVILRPLDLGADLTITSTTKYQDGHGVSVGGAVVTRDQALLARLRRTRKTLGSIQAPHEAWLTLQGLRTLDLRVRRHCENALAVAQGLAQRPWVRSVTYPGLPSFPQRALATKLPAHGGVVVFELRGGVELAKAFLEELRLVTLAEHLGAIETLATHPATMSHGDVPRTQREAAGIGDGLIRLSVGLECPTDVLRDLDGAYERAARRAARVEAAAVLEVGGELLDEDQATSAHEVYRFVRAGRPVVVVVPHGAAAVKLGAALARAGIPATVLDDLSRGISATGGRPDDLASSFDAGRLRAALADVGVAVVSQRCSHDEIRTRLLGRPAPDPAPLFVADQLGVNGRLAPPRLRVALLGAGVVGGGVLARLAALPKHFELCAVLTRSPAKAFAAGVDPACLVKDFAEVLGARPDVLVELIGGVEPAATWIEQALAAGISVVTANKALLAKFAADLRSRATEAGAQLRASAAVGGAAPVLERLLAEVADEPRPIEAALSGTCNFVLERVTTGASLEEAVTEAQRRGFAERDPARDLDGRDLLDKLTLIGQWVWPEAETGGASVRGIADIDVATLRASFAQGERTVLVGSLEPQRNAQGRWVLRCRVAPARLGPDHPFARLRGAEVAVRWTDACGAERLVRGGGAGRWPTTEAVLGDLFDVRAALRRAPALAPESPR